ncbi:MAG: hypothetical protein M3131_02380 [Actinomycetota bacterium]|nr:hypothetical protein [Actinomycetota bacterium]
MTDFLDEKRKEIDARLRELRPLVDEYQRLEQAASALSGVTGSGSSRSTQRPSSRRRGSGGGGGRRRGRPRGSGKRALQAHELVSARPGITIPELADAMKIQTNYLYRVMPALQAEGKVRKEGNGWHPV